MDEAPRPRGLRLQVALMALTALLPVFWLIGRRTAPPPEPQPMIFGAGEAPVILQESARGLAANEAPVRLPAPADRHGAYRVTFVPGGVRGDGRPPYRVRLESPDGRDLWEGTWAPAGDPRAAAELVLPVAGLAPGRYALLVEDDSRTMRSFLFIAP